MNKIKIGTVSGRNIYIGNPSALAEGEYYIQLSGNRPVGLFVKAGGSLKPLCNCNNEVKEPSMIEFNILSNYHGKVEEITVPEGKDGISKVTYRKPKLEEKTVTITKNGVTEIKIGKNYDGLDDVTVIVNVEEK